MPTFEDSQAVGVLEIDPMGKPKAKREDPDEDVTKTLFAVKGSLKWHRWLKDFSDQLGTSGMGAIDEALREYAALKNFRPMPKRMPRQSD
jgi:hypothetical protein